jgi:hypothetical protein
VAGEGEASFRGECAAHSASIRFGCGHIPRRFGSVVVTETNLARFVHIPAKLAKLRKKRPKCDFKSLKQNPNPTKRYLRHLVSPDRTDGKAQL